MMDEEERIRMSHAGLLARSAEGHAAKGMRIKDQEDMWVEIQHHTFRNWVNVQLRETGIRVENLSEDLKDGLALVTLVEVLQKRRLRKVKRVLNQHQALENVSTALNAIADDGIKLVNIGECSSAVFPVSRMIRVNFSLFRYKLPLVLLFSYHSCHFFSFPYGSCHLLFSI